MRAGPGHAAELRDALAQRKQAELLPNGAGSTFAEPGPLHHAVNQDVDLTSAPPRDADRRKQVEPGGELIEPVHGSVPAFAGVCVTDRLPSLVADLATPGPIRDQAAKCE